MPEHVHLMVSEPERRPLARALQMVKQMVSRKLLSSEVKTPFWSPRYYDFNVWSEKKQISIVSGTQPIALFAKAGLVA